MGGAVTEVHRPAGSRTCVRRDLPTIRPPYAHQGYLRTSSAVQHPLPHVSPKCGTKRIVGLPSSRCGWGLFEPGDALERVLWCGRSEDFRNRHGGPARVALNLEPTFAVHSRHEILRYSWLVGLKPARSRSTRFVRGSIVVVTCLAPSIQRRSPAMTTEPTAAISRRRRPRGRYPKHRTALLPNARSAYLSTSKPTR